MAGTLFGMGLSQQFDINGKPLSGCLLYVYQASSSTPVSTFSDFGLSVLLPFPIVANSAGRLPPIWVADGAYRARLTDSAGDPIFDYDNIQAVGASTGGGGGGGGAAVDPTAIYQTGDLLWTPVAGTRTGWVRGNARTIGSATSGATERANADTQPLYTFLWTNYTDALCPVAGGRGGTALADFNANKAIGTLDMRGYGGLGLDDMGNSAAGRIVGGTPTVAASAGGLEKSSITIAQANLPSFNLDLSGLSITNVTNISNISPTSNTFGSTLNSPNRSVLTGLGNAGVAPTIAGTVPSGGSGTAISATTISPYRMGTWYLKL